jgi:Flp pilus assembly protein TadG
VEVAVSLLAFLLIGFGLIEGGMLAWSNGTLQHAAEEGARYALRATKTDGTAMDEATVKNAVIYAAYGLNLAAANVTVRVCPFGSTCDPLCADGNAYATRTRGDTIRVCAQVIYQPMFAGLFISNAGLSLSRQAQIKVE